MGLFRSETPEGRRRLRLSNIASMTRLTHDGRFRWTGDGGYYAVNHQCVECGSFVAEDFLDKHYASLHTP